MKKKLAAYVMVEGPVPGLLMARLPRRFSFPEFHAPMNVLFVPTEEGFVRFSYVNDAALQTDFRRDGHVIIKSRELLEYLEKVQKDLALNGFPREDLGLH